MKSILCLILILFVNSLSFSQDLSSTKASNEAKNSLVLSAGTILFVSNASISYERRLSTIGARGESSLWVKGRYSKFSGWITPDEGRFFDATVFTLLGAGRSFTELSLGVGMFPYDPSLAPTASVGYRFQKQDGGIIFRTGMGFPELFYLGLGYSF